MSCDIIVPVWNQPQLTKACVECIMRNTRYSYRLIMIDNGSERETQKYLQQLSEELPASVSLIRNEVNLGYVKAVNQGLAVSGADFMCLFNNDVFVGRGWLSEMIEICNHAPDIGIVNPKSEESRNEITDTFLMKKTEEARGSRGELVEIMGAVGFCMLIKREAFLKIGFLDERFGLGGWDDMDYSRRAWELGYRCVLAKGAFVIHKVHSSFNRLGKRKKINIGKHTRKLFWEKWGQVPRLAFVCCGSCYDETLIRALQEKTLTLAREWNILHLLVKDSAYFFDPTHESISFIRIKESFYLLRCFLRLFKLKKRRLRYRKIFVDNRRYANFLRMLRFIHGAEIIHF